MPSISQQDYIIIDWEGDDYHNAAKKAEVDAQLKNIYLANPLALLSVIFKNYSALDSFGTFTSAIFSEGIVSMGFSNPDSDGTIELYQFQVV